MKRIKSFLITICLLLLIIYSGLMILDTMVTDKYQIEHGWTFLEMDADELTKSEIKERSAKIELLTQKNNRKKLLFTILGITSIVIISFDIYGKVKSIKT